MARTTLLLFYLLFIPLFNIHQDYCKAQDVKIEITSLEVVNNKLVISFDFVEDNKGNRYDVWVEITSLSGKRINARTLKGDLGDKLDGGKGKQIIWDYIADDVVLNEEINVEVKALISSSEISTSTGTNLGKAVLMSAVFPGWGISKVDPGKPYWILGATTYLLAGSSLLLNRSADSNYSNYITDLNQESSDNSLEKSKSQDQLSKVTAYSAIGIWAINIIWTAVKASKTKTESFGSLNNQRLYLFSNIDKHLGTKGFTVQYRF
ncbi:MAG: hypothetical protein ABFS35_14785 [Bacteroidota bacterium]